MKGTLKSLRLPRTGVPRFIALRFISSDSVRVFFFFFLHKLKARPSTGKNIATRLHAVVWNRTRNYLQDTPVWERPDESVPKLRKN